jgi:hypothetical protein
MQLGWLSRVARIVMERGDFGPARQERVDDVVELGGANLFGLMRGLVNAGYKGILLHRRNPRW